MEDSTQNQSFVELFSVLDARERDSEVSREGSGGSSARLKVALSAVPGRVFQTPKVTTGVTAVARASNARMKTQRPAEGNEPNISAQGGLEQWFDHHKRNCSPAT